MISINIINNMVINIIKIISCSNKVATKNAAHG